MSKPRLPTTNPRAIPTTRRGAYTNPQANQNAQTMEYIKSLQEDTEYLKEMLQSLKQIRQREKEFFENMSAPSSPDFARQNSFLTPSRSNSLFSQEAEKAWSMEKKF